MKTTKTLIALGFAFLILPASALATLQSGQSTSDQTTTTNQSTINNQSSKIQSTKCANIEARIQTKLQNYSSCNKKFITAYDNMSSRIDKFITKAKTDGYDVTKLETDFTVFKTMIANFKTEVSSSHSLLEQTQEYTCGKSEGQFVSLLAQSRDQFKTAHKTALDIRAYYKDTIRVDLWDIKTQTIDSTFTSPSTDFEE